MWPISECRVSIAQWTIGAGPLSEMAICRRRKQQRSALKKRLNGSTAERWSCVESRLNLGKARRQFRHCRRPCARHSPVGHGRSAPHLLRGLPGNSDMTTMRLVALFVA